SLTDARLLAFPVRSLRGVFAWVTCRTVLERLERDAALAGLGTSWPIPDVVDNQVAVPVGCPCLVDNQVILEEFEFTRIEADSGPIAKWVADSLLPDARR